MTITPDTNPLWRLVGADEILAIRDWLEELCELPAAAYNALTHQAILAEEAEPAERSATLQLTSDQQKAIDGILQDISQPGAKAVLCGYAGTGKTVTTAALVSALIDRGKRVVVATPTHKARAQVERALLTCGADGFEAVTVHRMLGLKQVRDKNSGKETFEPDKNGKNMLTEKERYDEDQGKKVPVSPVDVVIVDETSMLSSELYDLLLHELNGRPVVFVGDDRQLLPVGEEQVCRAFTEAQSLYRLTDVLRHDGAILNLATFTRQMAVGRAPFAAAQGGGSRVVAHRSREQWLNELLELAASTEARADPDFCRALAWTNKAVEELNDRIHVRRYGPGAPQFLSGMTCVTVDAIPGPDGGQPLINSTMDVIIREANVVTHRFRVDDLPGRPGFYLDDKAKALDIDDIPVDWKVWDLTVAFPEEYVHPVSFRVIHKDSEKQWNNAQRAIAGMAKEATGEYRRDLWDLYFKYKDSVGKLQPASALTIHKSQGSTFKNVWLHWSVDGWGSAPTAQQNQLAYVGITRAAESLHVVADR